MKIAFLGSGGFALVSWVGIDTTAVLMQDYVLGPGTIVEPRFGIYLAFLLGALALAAKIGKSIGELTSAIKQHAVDQKEIVAEIRNIQEWRAHVDPILTEWQVRMGIDRKEIG